MPARRKLPVPYEKSKAIATITTILSTLIFKFPEGLLKDNLLILVGFRSYLTYHVVVLAKRLIFREFSGWLSLLLTEKRVNKYLRELKEERNRPDTSAERLLEIN